MSIATNDSIEVVPYRCLYSLINKHLARACFYFCFQWTPKQKRATSSSPGPGVRWFVVQLFFFCFSGHPRVFSPSGRVNFDVVVVVFVFHYREDFGTIFILKNEIIKKVLIFKKYMKKN